VHDDSEWSCVKRWKTGEASHVEGGRDKERVGSVSKCVCVCVGKLKVTGLVMGRL